MLNRLPAPVRFCSAEPLLEELNLEPWLGDIQWLIAGGESGPEARPMERDWARGLRDQCRRAGVKFFLKQLGGHPDKRGGQKALLDGRTWTEMPQVRRGDARADPQQGGEPDRWAAGQGAA